MSVKRKYLLYTSVLLALIFCVRPTECLKYKSSGKVKADPIEKYFPVEKNLLVVQMELNNEVFLPSFHIPVLVFTKDQVLQDCDQKLTDIDGYVFMTSNAANLEEQMIPLLKCLNLKTSNFKTKFILVIITYYNDYNSDHRKNYVNLFNYLWKAFGIINIAILPVQDQSLTNDSYFISSYNPFLARNNASHSALKINLVTEDIRASMTDRFRNMHGHGLRTVLYINSTEFGLSKSVNEKQTLGENPGTLFLQTLKERLNVSFDVYENITDLLLLGKEIRNKAEMSTDFFLFPPFARLLLKLQAIPSGHSVELIFVVPKPRQVKSWTLGRYIFQWQVWVGLVGTLFLLSGAALLIQFVHSKANTQTHRSTGGSEVVFVWKAALSVSVNRLPKTHSQRLLIVCSLLLGLIFVTLFSVKLFALIKSKPRMTSIKTLQDLHDSNLPIYAIRTQFAAYLNVFENSTLRNLKDNLKTDKLYENISYLDPMYLKITDRALLCVSNAVNLIMLQQQNQGLSEYFEVVKEPIYQDVLQFLMPPGSVYYEHFHNLSNRLLSGGIFLKWYYAFQLELVERNKALSTPTKGASEGPRQTNKQPIPLTYEDLKLAFYILYIGLTVSFLCFLIEMFHSLIITPVC